MTEWKLLGDVLGVPNYVLERIEMDNYTALKRQREMLAFWISSGDASWRKLVQALRSRIVSMEKIANGIASQHKLINISPLFLI